MPPKLTTWSHYAVGNGKILFAGRSEKTGCYISIFLYDACLTFSITKVNEMTSTKAIHRVM